MRHVYNFLTSLPSSSFCRLLSCISFSLYLACIFFLVSIIITCSTRAYCLGECFQCIRRWLSYVASLDSLLTFEMIGLEKSHVKRLVCNNMICTVRFDAKVGDRWGNSPTYQARYPHKHGGLSVSVVQKSTAWDGIVMASKTEFLIESEATILQN